MILVTGGLGFVGPNTARALLDLGQNCVLTRRHGTRVPAFLEDDLGKRVFVERLDLADRGGLLELGERHRIDGIVHLAAEVFDGAAPLEYVKLSSETLFNVLDAAQQWAVGRVCLASTIGVYAGAFDQPSPLSEDLPLPLAASAPLSIPTVKRSAELLASFVGARADFEVINMRFSAIWGPLGRKQSPFFIAPAMIHAAVSGRAAEFDPRQQNRYAADGIDLCYVKDCARAVALLQTRGTLAHATYNVGSGRATSNAELLAAIAEHVPGARPTLSEGRDPNGPGGDTYLDIGRLQRDTGYQPEYTTDRAVADYITWLRAGNDR
ncbi:MAG: NAD(P)-dependent oxidoreductase [Solirubrobacterales bacterium]|nr:NAD(P)-dependent oxidoreductase [Solirubrobacterales bacterium]